MGPCRVEELLFCDLRYKASTYLLKIKSPLKYITSAYSYHSGWGLVETGGYYPVDNPPDHGVDSLEFSEDGETWETISSEIPGQYFFDVSVIT